MKFGTIGLAVVAIALAAPAVHTQEDTVRTRPGMIGVTVSREGEAVRVVEVRRGSPAEVAGVREGDVVVTVDGHPAGAHFPHLSQRLRAGETVRLQVERDGSTREVAVVATARPPMIAFMREGDPRGERQIYVYTDTLERPLRALTVRIDSLHDRLLRLDSAGVRVQIDSMFRVLTDSGTAFLQPTRDVRIEVLRASQAEAIAGRERQLRVSEARPFFMELGRRAAAGAELAAMNEGLARYFGGQRSGALVIEVGPGTPAERAGLQPGDVIVRAGGAAVSGPDDVRRHLAGRAGSLPLQVIRDGRRHDLTLEWESEGRHVIIRGRGEGRPEN